MSGADEFPEMPTRFCIDCKRWKKLMFFARTGSYCRKCSAKRNAAQVTPNPVPADPMVLFGDKAKGERLWRNG